MSNEGKVDVPAVPEQELSALLTTSLPYMTPVGRARLGQDIAQLYSSVSAPAVPQGAPEINYPALIEAAFAKNRKWTQGTTGCIAFERGAEWFREQAIAATQAPAPAQYKDSTPQLSVGESSFESWFESYNPANKGDKQRARDAYAAGMGDPLVAAAPAQEPVTLTDDELIDAWNSVEPGPDSTENVIVLRMRAIIAALRAKGGK